MVIADFFDKPIVLKKMWNTGFIFEHDGKTYSCDGHDVYEGENEDL